MNVTIVDDGEQAVKAATSESFDIILMDMQMPVMNGYEATEDLRKKKVTLPIVALTANTLDNDREKCFKVGMNEYLSKPFTADQLIKKIRLFLGD